MHTIETRQLTPQELEEFEATIRIACELRADEKIGRKVKLPPDNIATLVPDHFKAVDGSLVVSFDAGWNPFLCQSSGWNLGPQRWYIPIKSRLLATIASALQKSTRHRRVRGGRVFLNSSGARLKTESLEEVQILTWQLPRSSKVLP